MSYDVIVVGAGPAGCAAAIELAGAGRSVLLLERGELPQAKTCGDALLPEAVQILEELGLAAALRTAAMALPRLQLHAPGGRSVALDLATLSLPRQQLHALLQERALAVGVVLQRAEVLGPLAASGTARGVRYRDPQGETHEARAALILLACGSRQATLEAFAVKGSAEPTAVGIRTYYRVLGGEPATAIQVALQRQLAPGFGWVVPLPGGFYNIGCGRLLAGLRPEQIDLRRLLDDFIHSFEPAWTVAAYDDQVGTPCAGLLCTGLTAACLAGDGVLLAGDAVGTAQPLFGAGVAAALTSGRLAARTALAALQGGDLSAAFLQRLQGQLAERFQPRYRSLQRAEGWLGKPRRLDLLARHAGRKPATAALLVDVIGGAAAPEELFSLRGLLGLAGKR